MININYNKSDYTDRSITDEIRRLKQLTKDTLNKLKISNYEFNHIDNKYSKDIMTGNISNFRYMRYEYSFCSIDDGHCDRCGRLIVFKDDTLCDNCRRYTHPNILSEDYKFTVNDCQVNLDYYD